LRSCAQADRAPHLVLKDQIAHQKTTRADAAKLVSEGYDCVPIPREAPRSQIQSNFRRLIMLNRIAQILNAKVLLGLAGVVLALFLLSGLSATLWGQHPTNSVADAFSTVVWFGFLLGFVALIAVSVISLVAHGLKRREIA
jgi:sterol desaturase/sphingolipid hydroxylase (fatty acid hydroxylase superfamily)